MMNNLTEFDVLSLSKSASFFEACVKVGEDTSCQEIEKETAQWYEENYKELKLMALLLRRLSKEAVIVLANSYQNKKVEEGLLVLKRLVMPRLISSVSKMAYLVYKNPNSPFVSKLIENFPELLQNSIIRYRITKAGERVVVVIDHEKYISSLIKLRERYDTLLAEKLNNEDKKEEGVVDENSN